MKRILTILIVLLTLNILGFSQVKREVGNFDLVMIRNQKDIYTETDTLKANAYHTTIYIYYGGTKNLYNTIDLLPYTLNDKNVYWRGTRWFTQYMLPRQEGFNNKIYFGNYVAVYEYDIESKQIVKILPKKNDPIDVIYTFKMKEFFKETEIILDKKRKGKGGNPIDKNYNHIYKIKLN